MWKCPVCSSTHVLLKFLKHHVTYNHLNRGWQPPFRCGQEGCSSSFSTINCWKRHLQYLHGHLEFLSSHDQCRTSMAEQNLLCPSAENLEHIASSSSWDLDITDDSQTSEKLVEASGIRFVAELRANSSVTVSACEKAVNLCNDVTEAVVDAIKQQVASYLEKKLPDQDNSALMESLAQFSRPLEFLATDKCQKRYFCSQDTFVEPVQYIFGIPRLETHYNRQGLPFQKQIYDSWQYIPLEKSLQTLLAQPGVFEMLTLHLPREDGIIEEFMDGSNYRKHPLFSSSAAVPVILELYYDDVETANPLGSKATVHKIGVFYFMVKNLPSYFNSCMANIHLLALAYTGDLKKYGYNAVLNKIAEDVHCLETIGGAVVVSGENLHFTASIGSVNGDNLGRHAIFGLFESFRANRFCETCNASLPEIQEKFRDSDFDPRTKAEYEMQLREVLNDPSKSSQYGIKKRCALNDTQHWHQTENMTGDLMHDFLEGVGPFELKLVLNALFNVSQVTTLDEVNSRISGFLFGITDSKNKPSLIQKLDMKDHSLKQKAFQFYCLFRLLPLIIGDLIPEGNVFWEFYLDLRRVADYLFAQRWSLGMVAQFEDLWEEHQAKFKTLFPDYALIPKHHFLCHYGRFVLATGPQYKMMVAPQEMKSNFFKRIAHIMCNFMNVPRTLAFKHQFFANYVYLAELFNRNCAESIHGSSEVIETLTCSEMISTELGISSESKVCMSSEFLVRGQHYKKGNCLVLRKDTEPIFGRLCFAVSENFRNKKIVLVVKELENIAFEKHMWCYRVKKKNMFLAFSYGKLCDFHPLDMYSAFSANQYFVVPRYLLS